MAVRGAAIGRMDRAIGRVLEQVKAMGAWNQTLVLFTSCSGAVVNSEMVVNAVGAVASPADTWGAHIVSVANTPFRFGGGTVFEGGIAVPLIAHWPAGVKTKRFTFRRYDRRRRRPSSWSRYAGRRRHGTGRR